MNGGTMDQKKCNQNQSKMKMLRIMRKNDRASKTNKQRIQIHTEFK